MEPDQTRQVSVKATNISRTFSQVIRSNSADVNTVSLGALCVVIQMFAARIRRLRGAGMVTPCSGSANRTDRGEK